MGREQAIRAAVSADCKPRRGLGVGGGKIKRKKEIELTKYLYFCFPVKSNSLGTDAEKLGVNQIF